MLLLVGAVIGISVSATDDPTVEITAKNISYEGAVRTLYIVETANSDDLTVQVNFYDTDPANGGELLYSKGITDKITLDEIVAALCAEYEVDEDVAKANVEKTVAALEKARILEK